MAVEKQMEAVFSSVRGYKEGGSVDKPRNRWEMLVQWFNTEKEEDEDNASAFERFLKDVDFEFMGDPIERSKRKKYNEGGIEVDPVSGNEVPTGSLPEEVRDDIPAQLSEGEYVVPADVVRYYGVKFFEDIRNAAKAGWADMEQNGRIGGEPVAPEGMEMGGDELPFDISELQTVEAAEGAYISGYDEGGVAVPPTPQGYNPNSGMVEVKEYVGPNGEKMFVQFMNGMPLTVIPEGYKLADTVQEEVAEKVAEPVQNNDDDGPTAPKPEAKPAIDWATAKPEDFTNYMEQRDSLMNKAVMGGAALFGGPLMGGLATLAGRHQDKRMLAGLDKQLETMQSDDPNRAKLQAIRDTYMEGRDKNKDGEVDGIIERSGIFGGGDSLTDGLTDMSGDGKSSFADTWLGDLLGLDGEAGVQGPNLADSRAGARRNFGDDDDNDSSPTITPSSGSSSGSSPRPQLRPSSTPSPSVNVGTNRGGRGSENPNTSTGQGLFNDDLTGDEDE